MLKVQKPTHEESAGVGAASANAGACKAACVVMYDPWYPAIPNDSPARSQWQSGCPALVLGSVAFNTKSEKGTIAAEGQEVGLQVCERFPVQCVNSHLMLQKVGRWHVNEGCLAVCFPHLFSSRLGLRA